MNSSRVNQGRTGTARHFAAATLRLALSCLLANANALCTGDDSPLLIPRLRQAVADVVSHPLTREERFDFSRISFIRGDRDVLAALGSAQVALNDLTGAQQTARAIFGARHESFNPDLEAKFICDLTVALGATGEVEAAYVLFKKYQLAIRQAEIEPVFIRSRVGMARALARSGRSELAKRVCEDTVRDLQSAAAQRKKAGGYAGFSWYERGGLFQVASTQAQLKDTTGAQRTRGIIEAAMGELSAQGEYSRRWWYPQLAELAWSMGDTTGASRLLGEARSISNLDFVNWRGIVRLESRQGDPTGALRDVGKIREEFQRNMALMELVLDQARRGNLDFLERIVHDNFQGTDARGLLQVGIAKARAESGDVESALRLTHEIRCDVRRAQAILEIAAVLAKQNQKPKAQGLGADLAFLREDDHLLQHPAKSFDFDKPETWTGNYLGWGGGSLGIRLNDDIEGDLLGAAVRCRVVLDGAGSIRAIPAIRDRWDVRKAAAAQAGEGDVAGALSWFNDLPRPRRMAALVGAASGYAHYRGTLKHAKSREITLDPDHFLSRHYFGHLLDEDE
jgi:hypothetical protein